MKNIFKKDVVFVFYFELYLHLYYHGNLMKYALIIPILMIVFLTSLEDLTSISLKMSDIEFMTNITL